MSITHAKELASGLMTFAVALTLVSAPAAYLLPGNTNISGLMVSGSAGSYAGMTVAIPVSGAGEQAVKFHKSGHVHLKHAGS